MRHTTFLVLALGAAGCSDGLYTYPDLDTADTADTAADTDPVIDTDPQDSGTDSGDTGSDTGTDDFSGCHPVDPHGKTSWTRTYSVVINDASGTEVHTGIGGGRVQSDLNTSGDKWGILTNHDCTSDGTARVVSWAGNVTVNANIMGLPMTVNVSVEATHSNPRPYLKDIATLEGTGSWPYNYNLQLSYTSDMGASTASVPTSGQYLAMGKQPVTVAGKSWQAYYITNDATQDWSSVTELGRGVEHNWSESWWVEGLGMVKEVVTDVDTGKVVMQKELQSYTGLTPS